MSSTFAELGVSRAVTAALAADGIETPFEVQRMVIRDVLAGRDVLVRSPTGSGKTLAFGIPMVDRIAADAPRPSALILAPTRELASQITDDLRRIAHARALRITTVYGGVGLVKQAENAARSQIVVATPGRLEDLLARRAFTLANIRLLILDEADRMLDMGFRPAVDRIVAACPAERQTLFFSATLDGEAGAIAARYTHDAIAHAQGGPERSSVAEIEHRFVPVTDEGRLDALVAELSSERELTLVFVRTKHGADRLVKRLSRVGIEAVAMHGNKSQRQRERALAQFENGHVDVLVATDVASRGIDVTGISHVINFEPPHDDESYVHRVGRTGRAGRTGIGITLVAAAERGDVAKLAGRLGLDHGLGGGGRHAAEGRGRVRAAGPRPGARGRQGNAARQSGPRPSGQRPGGSRPSGSRQPEAGRHDATSAAGRPRRNRSRRHPGRAAA